MHRRKGAKVFEVDYYRLITGDLSKMVMQDLKDESQQIEFYKITKPRLVITCVDCWQKDEVRKNLDELFSGIPEDKPNGKAEA
jgi:hypothetical protein